ncbi:MAG: MATE family efflux transporter [Salibacteraceae bacterium]
MHDGNIETRVSFREINRLALPAILAGIAEPLLSLADTAIIGQLGSTEQGAVGMAASFYTLLIWVFSQSKTAISALTSRRLGEGRLTETAGLIPQAVGLVIGIGIFLALVTRWFPQPIFRLYQAEGAVLDIATEYYLIRAWGFPFTLATFLLFGVFRGIQNTSWAMKISLVGAVINLGLDLLLVFGWDPIVPALGVAGAAWASLIAQVVMLGLTLYFFRRKVQLKLRFIGKWDPLLSTMIQMSSNLILRALALNVAFYFGTRLATGYGEAALAAYTIGVNIWLFSSFFIDGYSGAGNAISGRLIGAGAVSTLRRLGIDLMRSNLVVGTALGLCYLIAYPWMASFFSTDEAVIDLFNGVFWLILLAQPVNALAFTFDGLFKGLGRTALLRNVLMGSSLLVFLPLVYLLDAAGLALAGIWWSFFAWMTARAIPLVWIFFKDYQSS